METLGAGKMGEEIWPAHPYHEAPSTLLRSSLFIVVISNISNIFVTISRMAAFRDGSLII